MRDKAATPVLDFGEDVAWYQTGSGAAQDDVFLHEALYIPEDILLDLKLLEHTLLENATITGGNYNQYLPVLKGSISHKLFFYRVFF